MKNTLLNLIKTKGYTVTTSTSSIAFCNDLYSINLYINDTTLTASIHLIESDVSSSTFLISFNSISINIKSIRTWLDTMVNLQINYSSKNFTSLTLINDSVLKKCYADLLNVLDDYLIHLAINKF